MTDKTSAYLRTQILTARPEQLTLMLFDAGLRFAEKARRCIAEKNYEGSFEALTRAQEVVMELLNGLRPDADPELCRRQAGLYLFVYSRLVEANMTRQAAPLDDAARILGTLRETWLLLMEKLQAESAAGGASASARPAATPAVSVQG